VIRLRIQADMSEHYCRAKEKLTIPIPNSCADSSSSAIGPALAFATGEYAMIRAELAVAAIALVATVAVASAQAQTQIASPDPTIWDHNGSVMYLVAQGCWR
jgi:hypothetical protein